MILPPGMSPSSVGIPGMSIPPGMMYGRPPGPQSYDLLRPVITSKDGHVVNLPPGMIPPPKSVPKMDHKTSSQIMHDHHQQQLQHAEMYRRSITNSSPSPIRGPPGSTMMIHPPPGMAIGSADYRSFVERIHREQREAQRDAQMMIDINAAKQLASQQHSGHPGQPPSAHGGQRPGQQPHGQPGQSA